MTTKTMVDARFRLVPSAVLAFVFMMICLYAHHDRLRYPSLFSDDVMRIADLQVGTLGSTLFRPFNEHMAPFFEVVSWVAWQLADTRLENAALAFTIASYVPFVLCLVLLGLIVRRELGSTTTALTAVALFSISSVYAEAIYWYSASSFTWALFWTLATLLASSSALSTGSATVSRRSVLPLGLAFLAAMLAPACSAIGLLAGPLGGLRLLLDRDRDRDLVGSRRNRIGAMVPLAGTFCYLALCRTFRYQEVLSESIERNIDLRLGLLSIARAPIDVLGPGLLGFGNLDFVLGGGLDLFLFGVGLIAALVWARRSPQRPLILGGLLLILGGYAMTYPVRTVHGPHWILEIQRYHLFPQLGLVLLLAPALRPILARFDIRPARATGVSALIALLLLLSQRGGLKHEAKVYRFPDQADALKAMDHLGDLCRDQGITREQALAALDPIRRRWFPHDFNALQMIALGASEPRVPNALVRPLLLADLSSQGREALCGGMDATPYLQPADEYVGLSPFEVGHLVESYQIRSAGSPGRYVAEGVPACLEFELSDAKSGASAALCLPSGGPLDKPLEIWWTDDGTWSEGRSIRWCPDPLLPPQEWAIPLDRLPHWEASESENRRLRVLIRTREPIAVGAPRLLR